MHHLCLSLVMASIFYLLTEIFNSDTNKDIMDDGDVHRCKWMPHVQTHMYQKHYFAELLQCGPIESFLQMLMHIMETFDFLVKGI